MCQTAVGCINEVNTGFRFSEGIMGKLRRFNLSFLLFVQQRCTLYSACLSDLNNCNNQSCHSGATLYSLHSSHASQLFYLRQSKGSHLLTATPRHAWNNQLMTSTLRVVCRACPCPRWRLLDRAARRGARNKGAGCWAGKVRVLPQHEAQQSRATEQEHGRNWPNIRGGK